jgi:predicted membrane protein
MKRIYDNLNPKKFRFLSTVLLILCDFMILGFLYRKFTNKEMFERILGLTFKINPQLNSRDLTPALSAQLYELLTNSLLSSLCLVLLYHFFIYIMWSKEKKFAANYIALYVWIAAPGTMIGALMGFTDNFLQSLLFLIWSGIFFFVAFGLSQFPIKIKKIGAK